MRSKYRTRCGLLAVAALACITLFAQSREPVTQPPAATQPAPRSQPGATQPTTGPAPKLELEPTDFRFGETWQGFAAEREFTVRNVGEAPLTVEVTTSCGCTVASKPKSPLAPGETGTFKVTYQTGGPGPVDRRVTVMTNDPARTNVDIPVQGTVKRLYEIKPDEFLTFEELDRDSRASRSVRIESQYTGALRMKVKPDQDLGPFEVTLREIQPGREFELTATTKPPLPVGWSNAAVEVETGLENVAPVTVHLAAEVPPRVAVGPASLFVTSRSDKPAQQTLRVQYRRDEPIDIVDVKCDLPAVQYEVLPPSEPPEGSRMAFREIRVTLPRFVQLPAQGGKLEIFTSAEGEFAKLTVPIERRSLPTRREPKYRASPRATQPTTTSAPAAHP
jgi:hypothetical protein